MFTALEGRTFLSSTSAKTILIENVIVGVLAIVFLIPLTTGTYDLSIGTMMTMSLVITNSVAKNTDLPQVVGMALGLFVCAVAGFISGFVVIKLRVNSFIATLGMSQIITAFVYFTSEQTISGELTKDYQKIGTRLLFGLPLFCYYLGAIAVVVWFVLEHTPIGRHMFATGGNTEAAASPASPPTGWCGSRSWRRGWSPVSPALCTRGRSAPTGPTSAPGTCSPRSWPCSSALRRSRDGQTSGGR